MPCCKVNGCGGYVSYYQESGLDCCAINFFKHSEYQGKCCLQRLWIWLQSNWKFYKELEEDRGIIFMLTLFFVDFVQRIFSITDSPICRRFFHEPKKRTGVIRRRRKRIELFVLVMFFSSICVYLFYVFSFPFTWFIVLEIVLISLLLTIFYGFKESKKFLLIIIFPLSVLVTVHIDFSPLLPKPHIIAPINLWLSLIAVVFIFLFRILPILTMHMGTLLFSKHFERPERSILLTTLNYFECIFWFGVMYLAIGNQFYIEDKPAQCLNNHWSSALYYSMVTITTLGYGDIHPTKWLSRIISGFEAIIGVFFIAVVIGYFLSHLSRERK